MYKNIKIQAQDEDTGEVLSISPKELRQIEKEVKLAERDARRDLFVEGINSMGSDRGFFVKMYERGIYDIARLPKTEAMAYAVIQKYMKTNSPYVCISNAELSERMTENFGTNYKSNHCSVYLNALCEKGFIARMDKGVYFINPDICYKGDRRMVRKWLMQYNLFGSTNWKKGEGRECKSLDEFKELIDYNKEKVLLSHE